MGRVRRYAISLRVPNIMSTWPRCGERWPDARSDDEGVAEGALRRGGTTQQMAIFHRNPKGWAELLRRAALLVVAVLLSVRLPSWRLARRSNCAQRDHAIIMLGTLSLLGLATALYLDASMCRLCPVDSVSARERGCYTGLELWLGMKSPSWIRMTEGIVAFALVPLSLVTFLLLRGHATIHTRDT